MPRKKRELQKKFVRRKEEVEILDSKKMLTVGQAARIVQMTKGRISQMIWRKQIEAYKDEFTGWWLIPRSELPKIKRERKAWKWKTPKSERKPRFRPLQRGPGRVVVKFWMIPRFGKNKDQIYEKIFTTKVEIVKDKIDMLVKLLRWCKTFPDWKKKISIDYGYDIIEEEYNPKGEKEEGEQNEE